MLHTTTTAEHPNGPLTRHVYSARSCALRKRSSAVFGEAQWLEVQGPPEIVLSGMSARDTCTVFVPVNDTSVLVNSVLVNLESRLETVRELETETARLQQDCDTRADDKALGKELKKTEKTLTKARQDLQSQSEKGCSRRKGDTPRHHQCGPSISGFKIEASANVSFRSRPTNPRLFFSGHAHSPHQKYVGRLMTLPHASCGSVTVFPGVHEVRRRASSMQLAAAGTRPFPIEGRGSRPVAST